MLLRQSVKESRRLQARINQYAKAQNRRQNPPPGSSHKASQSQSPNPAYHCYRKSSITSSVQQRVEGKLLLEDQLKRDCNHSRHDHIEFTKQDGGMNKGPSTRKVSHLTSASDHYHLHPYLYNTLNEHPCYHHDPQQV